MAHKLAAHKNVYDRFKGGWCRKMVIDAEIVGPICQIQEYFTDVASPCGKQRIDRMF